MMNIFNITLRHYLPTIREDGKLNVIVDTPLDPEINLKDITFLGDEKIYVIEYNSNYIYSIFYISAEDYGIHRVERRFFHGKPIKDLRSSIITPGTQSTWPRILQAAECLPART